MKRKKLLYLVIILFIAVNSLLVYLDDEQKVVRKSYIEKWAEVFKKDLVEKINKKGILTTVEKKHVYFDDDRGSFEKFIVEKGTKVNTGDKLYSYQAADYYNTKAVLESEQLALSGEISAIEQAISDISFEQIPQTNLSVEGADSDEDVDVTGESVEANYMKEQFLAEKEKELAQKEAQLESVQQQLSDLESSGDTIVVESPYQGEVTAISNTLSNPVITIRDMQLQAEGELTESERMEVEQDMPVNVIVEKNGTLLKGKLHQVSDSPKTMDLDRESRYTFQVRFDEKAETDTLLPGYHTNMEIITDEARGATAVKDSQLFGRTLWKMTSEGKLEKQNVKTDIHMADIWEITKGAKTGEWIAEAEKSQFRPNATFITPLKLTDIEWKHLNKYDNVNWKRYVVIGLLAR